MKFKKKPVTIEAFQYDGDLINNDGSFCVPDWAEDAWNNNIIKSNDPVKGTLVISTLEGEMTANVGDYIIQGINGELYPCKEDIFLKTYERVCDDSPMVHDMPLDEFRNTGLLWWINRQLHLFGVALAVDSDENGKNSRNLRPMRCKHRGFSEDIEENGYKKVTEYIMKNSTNLLDDIDNE